MSSTSSRLVQTTWLQCFLSHRTISETYAQQLYQSICQLCQVEYQDDQYEPFLDDVCRSVSRLDIEIRRSIDPISGKPILAIVNTKGDDIAQLATRFSANEVAFIKILIREIVTAPQFRFSISFHKATSLGSQLKSQLTRKACHQVLIRLVQSQWIVESRSHQRYSLSTRSLLELGGYLRNEFPDSLLYCKHCRDILTKGSICSNDNCLIGYHFHCLGLLQIDQNFTCPSCKSLWHGSSVGGEDEVEGSSVRADDGVDFPDSEAESDDVQD